MTWQTDDIEHAGPEMVSAAKLIEESVEERRRRAMSLVYARLATGRNLSSIFGYDSVMSASWVFDVAGQRAPMNVIQAVQEAIAAKIAKNKPRPMLLTQDGDYNLRRQAKGMTKFLDGLNDATKVYKLGRKVFADAGYFGTGIFRPYQDTTRNLIATDRVLLTQVFVDEIEAANGEPNTLFEKRYVYRQQLARLFSKKAAIIEQAQAAYPDGMDTRRSEMIPVYMGWSLGNRAIVAIAEGTLSDDVEWKYDWFPHTRFDWRAPITGFWGAGITENLAGLQREINVTLARIADSARAAKQWIFVRPGAKLVKSHMTNEPGTIIETEDPPTFTTGITVPPELFNWVDRIYARCLDMEGVSALSLSGQKPAGMSAAVALREYHDIESERFVQIGQAWEECFVELADKQIALSRDMYKGRKSVVIKAPGTKFLESIKWEDVDMPENMFTVRTYPTSLFPTSPAAKLQKITELFESGFIPDRETALSLLDFPDLDASLSLQLSSIEEINRILGQIVDGGKYEPPDPYINLAQAKRICQGMILKARGSGVPSVRIEKLMRWLDDAVDLEQQMAPKQAPVSAQPVAGQPPAMPAGPALGVPAIGAATALPEIPPQDLSGLPPPGTLDIVGNNVNPAIPSEVIG